MTPEAKVKVKIRKLLDSYTDVYVFMPVPHGFQGVSVDYLVCCCSRFIAIEAKAPGKHPTPLQENTMRRMTAAGGAVFIISNDDELAMLKDFLDNLY